MTESPYAALQPGDQVWLTGIGRGATYTLVPVTDVRRRYLDVDPPHGPPLAVDRSDGRVKDSQRRIYTQRERDELDRRQAATAALNAAGLIVGGHPPLGLATLERLAAVIREDTP